MQLLGLPVPGALVTGVPAPAQFLTEWDQLWHKVHGSFL